MTGYLSKGLEFDGVILLDAGEPVYRSERRLDLHLLYVAMTRPLLVGYFLQRKTLRAPLRIVGAGCFRSVKGIAFCPGLLFMAISAAVVAAALIAFFNDGGEKIQLENFKFLLDGS